jgi:3-deoxy-D-manno-octulosonic-acid transferase
MHAASVGETVAVLPLIERLAEWAAILLTTGTVTSAQIAAGRLPPGALHQFVPIDTPNAVARFLDHWRPDLALFVESELWPGAMDALHRRGVPLLLVNARLSERSFVRWRRLGPLARALTGCLAGAAAQSLSDAERFRALGAENVGVCGNLKFDVPPPPADPAGIERLRAAIGGRPVLLAASTHPGEEEAVLAAHAAIPADRRLLTILAPRHPERGAALAAQISAAGLTFARRSAGEPIGAADVYLADTIGEMGLWYRLADMAFLGGSLVPRGGQNPIEPAKLLVPILHGPHVANFHDVYGALGEAGAVVPVSDAAALGAAVRQLMDDPARRQRLAAEAQACVARSAGALDRTLAVLKPFLDRLGPHEASRTA